MGAERAVGFSSINYVGSTDQVESGKNEMKPFITASSMMMSASQLVKYTGMHPNEVYGTLGDLMFPRALAGSTSAAVFGGAAFVSRW